MNWQPIETAPKDGSRFLALWIDDYGFSGTHETFWNLNAGAFDNGYETNRGDCQPVLWATFEFPQVQS